MDLDTVVDTRRTLSNLGAIKFKVDRDRPELSLMDTLKCAFGHAIQYTFLADILQIYFCVLVSCMYVECNFRNGSLEFQCYAKIVGEVIPQTRHFEMLTEHLTFARNSCSCPHMGRHANMENLRHQKMSQNY